MKFYRLGLGCVLAAAAMGQTKIDLRTQTKSVDFSGANSTKPSKTGTALPANCDVGETFLKTDAVPGQNLYACTATNVWTVQGGGGGTGGAVSSVFGRTGFVTAQPGDYTASQVTNAVDKTAATAYGAGARQTFAPSASAAGMRVTPGSLPSSPQVGDMAVDSADANRAKVFDGTSWVRMTTIPNYASVFTSATTVTVPGSTHQLGTANLVVECLDNATPANLVEPDSIRINPSTYDVTVTFAAPQSGRLVINAAGGSGASNAIAAGAGIVATPSGGQTQVSVDSATVPTYLTASATLDFPSIASVGCSELTLGLAGAVAGDSVAPGWPGGLEAGLIGTMRVSAVNTVAVRLCNFSGAALNPASASFRAMIVRNF